MPFPYVVNDPGSALMHHIERFSLTFLSSDEVARTSLSGGVGRTSTITMVFVL